MDFVLDALQNLTDPLKISSKIHGTGQGSEADEQ